MNLLRCSVPPSRSPPPNGKRGFAIAPILYLLGLVGVGAGVLFSGYSQILRTNQTMSNTLASKNDLQGIATTLAATSWLSNDHLLLCPPSVGSNSPTTPAPNCSTAPGAISVGAAFSAGTASNMPAGAAAVSTTGTPVEAGIFRAGTGLKVLDPWGHYYLYCRWENGIGSANALAIISAGANGKTESKCGDTVGGGDDLMIVWSTAVTQNRAAVWQTTTSGTQVTGAQFGQTGSQVSIDTTGDVTVPGTLNVSGTTTLGSAVMSTQTAGSIIDNGFLTVAGTSTLSGALVGSSANFTGTLGVSGLSTLGTLSAGTTTLSQLTTTYNTAIGGTLGVTGATTLGQVTAGSSTLDSLGVIGNSAFGGLITTSSSKVQIGTAVMPSGTSLPLLTVGKPVSLVYPFNVDQYGNVNGAAFTGAFNGNLSGSQSGGSVSATTLAASGATTLSGALGGTSALFTGNVTAANFIGNMAVGSGGTTITGVIPLANGGTGIAASSAANLLSTLFTNAGTVSGMIPGADLVAHSVTATQLDAIATPGSYSTVTVGADGRVVSGSPAGGTSTQISDGSGQSVVVGTSGGIIFTVGSSTVGNWTSTGLTVGSSKVAVNKFDVYGAQAIGTGYAGSNTAPVNGLIVQGNVGIGTNAPGTNALQVNGTIQATNFVGNGAGLVGVGSGTVSSGTSGQVAYYQNSGTTVVGTSSILITANGNVAVGTTTAASKLTVNGSQALLFDADYSNANTSQSAVAINTMSAVRYTGAGAATFNGIVAGNPGQILNLHNASSYALTLANQSPSEPTSANKIITGTNSDLVIATNSSVTLQYDNLASRWRVIGGSGGGIPAGTTGQVQYNSGSSTFAAGSTFTWLSANNQLVVGTGAATPVGFGTSGQVAGIIHNVIPQAMSFTSLGGNAGPIAVGSATTGQMAYYSGGNALAGTPNVTLSGGNLGIGTATALSQLHIYGGAGQTVAALTDAGTRTASLQLDANGTSTGTGYAITFGNSQSEATGSLGFAAIKAFLTNNTANTLGDLVFATRNSTSDTALTERIRIMSAGGVGIGTSNPGANALQVNGTIAATTLNTTGVIKVGTQSSCATTDAGSIRYIGGATPFEYCDGGGSWAPFRGPRCQDDGTGACSLSVDRSSDDPEFTAANIRCGTKILGITGTLGDGSSAAFTFTDVTNANLSTLTTAGNLTISGIPVGCPGFAAVSGDGTPAISIAGGSWVTSGAISNGQTLNVRLTSSATASTTNTATITVGSTSDAWTVTTRVLDTTPDAFTITAQTGVNRSAQITSAAVTPTGYDGPLAISVTGGDSQISVAGGAYASSASISPGQSFTVRMTSASTFSTLASAIVTLGTVSATWNVTTGTTLAVDYLIVAGGGGGGGGDGAGGGGGGVLTGSTSTTTTTFTVVVGSGGNAGTSTNVIGGNGGNSSFNSLTAIGGGGGGSNSTNGNSGGSGGGGGSDPGAGGAGGAGTAGQGSHGGVGQGPGYYPTGGGGGAGGVGGSPPTNTSNSGAGGPGIASAISGSSVTYGGGGGGGIYSTGSPGPGGTGGGGAGAPPGGNATAGTANTGGGGGGSSFNLSSSARPGGSGIVIIRYPGPQQATGGTITSVGGYTIHTFTTGANFAPSPDPDITPDAFTVPDQTGVTRSTAITSAAVTPTGYTGPLAISVTGGDAQISVAGGSYTTSTTINPGQSFTVRMTSSGSYTTGTSATVTLGTGSATWTITTAAIDTTPDTFTVPTQTGVARSTQITSAAVTPTGYDGPLAISVSGGGAQISIAGGGYTSSGSISPGQSFTLQLTSSANYSTSSVATVTLGTGSATWTVTTLANITVININSNATNVNLFTLAGSPVTAGNYEFDISSGVTVYSTSTATAAITTGAFPAGSTVKIVNLGYIIGMGGSGGAGGSESGFGQTYGNNGNPGGPAMSLGIDVTINNTGGFIYGGGGGGAGGATSAGGPGAAPGGGGGGGRTQQTSAGAPGGSYGGGAAGGNGGFSGPGAGGPAGSDPFQTGLASETGGTGGDWGAAGGSTSRSGGAAGNAIAINAKTVTWQGGNDSTHVKGAVN